VGHLKLKLQQPDIYKYKYVSSTNVTDRRHADTIAVPLAERNVAKNASGRFLQGIEHWKYENILAYLRLPRLDMRRVRCDLINTFKIMHCIAYDVHTTQ